MFTKTIHKTISSKKGGSHLQTETQIEVCITIKHSLGIKNKFKNFKIFKIKYLSIYKNSKKQNSNDFIIKKKNWSVTYSVTANNKGHRRL